jgi:hypothetical protein
MKPSKKTKVDISKVIDQMVEDKKVIEQMIREGKKNELKNRFKFADPL